ncbi:MAG TPA: division/cell wall cluster transcriptional repressor MraZ [Acidimicrobiales bacterium]|nr:division/cell wall cluster transcriptional repressor MraZ [Acidimicrobiales bacterium]
MVVKFFGRYEHALDPKGRVILPAKFRGHFEQGGYLTQYWEGCLALWTPEEFEKQMVAMEAAQELGRSERNLARVWASGTQEAEVDRQGRLFLSPPLRAFAGLEAGVLVHGALNRIELWSPERWTAKLAATEQNLIDQEDAP